MGKRGSEILDLGGAAGQRDLGSRGGAFRGEQVAVVARGGVADVVGEMHNIIGAGWPPGGEGGRAGWRGDYLRVKGRAPGWVGGCRSEGQEQKRAGRGGEVVVSAGASERALMAASRSERCSSVSLKKLVALFRYCGSG